MCGALGLGRRRIRSPAATGAAPPGALPRAWHSLVKNCSARRGASAEAHAPPALLDDDADRAQRAIARAADAATELERALDIGERLVREALAGQDVGDTRRVRRQRLGGDAPAG